MSHLPYYAWWTHCPNVELDGKVYYANMTGELYAIDFERNGEYEKITSDYYNPVELHEESLIMLK